MDTTKDRIVLYYCCLTWKLRFVEEVHLENHFHVTAFLEFLCIVSTTDTLWHLPAYSGCYTFQVWQFWLGASSALELELALTFSFAYLAERVIHFGWVPYVKYTSRSNLMLNPIPSY